MKPSRDFLVIHPLGTPFRRAIESLTSALSDPSKNQYTAVARHFLSYLDRHHRLLSSLSQLRRDPHLLGWFASMRAQTPPPAPTVYICRLLILRCLLEELAWSARLPRLAHLLRSEDIPRAPQRLPRPLTTQQDQLIQQELRNRNDLAANVFLLLRHTGMRIGESVDLSWDCLHAVTPEYWAIHVPLGKLKRERLVPVDAFVCELVQRLRFFRSLDTLPPDGRLLARPSSKPALIRQLRSYLKEVAAAVGIPSRVVPHQLRHTYATEMARSGVSLPALMKLLGHSNPEMTMLYIEMAQLDLQREFHLARSHPRHLTPLPPTHHATHQQTAAGVLDSLLLTQHALEMFRRTLSNATLRRSYDRLSNRLSKILSEARKLATPPK
jgi:integrase